MVNLGRDFARARELDKFARLDTAEREADKLDSADLISSSFIIKWY